MREAVAIGVQVYPATGDAARRQAGAVEALRGLRRTTVVNLQFADGADSLDVEHLENWRCLEWDSRRVARRPGRRKPVVSEIFSKLARRGHEEGRRYVGCFNADIIVAQDAIDLAIEGGREVYLYARTDAARAGDPHGSLLLNGIDGFIVDCRWWLNEARRFRPYILGEATWDNVYASLMACHGDTMFVYEPGLLTHERHEPGYRDSPFADYLQYLAALDAPYFSLWCRYYDALVQRWPGSTRAERAALVAETFTWQPTASARVVQAGRAVKAWLRYAHRRPRAADAPHRRRAV